MTEPLRVFVASSSEQIGVAKRVAAALDSPALSAKVWDEETFDFSASYIESLEKELDRADFAVVILTGDDSGNVRRKQVNLPRDNVIYELGLFTGRLGRERCFFFVDGDSGTHIASDLSGVKAVVFEAKLDVGTAGTPSLATQAGRVAQQMTALGERYKAAPQVRERQAALWLFSHRFAGHWWERMRDGEEGRSALSYVTVTVDEVTNTPHLQGLVFDSNGAAMADWETVVSGVVVDGPPRIHYRWEGEMESDHGQKYGGGGYIEFDSPELASGRGYYYDTNFAQLAAGAHTRVKHFGLYRCEDPDVEIMKQSWSDEAVKLIGARLKSLRGR